MHTGSRPGMKAKACMQRRAEQDGENQRIDEGIAEHMDFESLRAPRRKRHKSGESQTGAEIDNALCGGHASLDGLERRIFFLYIPIYLINKAVLYEFLGRS